jgi:hypothetical protein
VTATFFFVVIFTDSREKRGTYFLASEARRR